MNDPHPTDWKAQGLDYPPGTNAFTSVPPKGESEATKLLKKQAKRAPEQNLLLIKTRMEKAAIRVNKGTDFHINTPLQDLESSDKRRKIISTSRGGR